MMVAIMRATADSGGGGVHSWGGIRVAFRGIRRPYTISYTAALLFVPPAKRKTY